ncbi:MAG: N-acetylmuramoyl-L-alanine amidase [Oscillospiraceae bacterium]|nr:N-acetylmuramoyl-L-alanine amidase [Oscillospiraceae bacterium]
MTKEKYNIIFYSILIFGYVAFAILMTRAYKKVDKQVVSQISPIFPSVILDAGHGGGDSGAVSPEGVFEKDINLSISKILKDMFLSSGFTVIMTREDDVSIHDKNLKTFRQKKISDLNNRLKFTKINQQNSILVSIHQNKFSQKTSNGAQIFYSNNDNRSQDLAMCIKQTINTMIQPNNKRNIKGDNNIFLLKNSKIPSVIVECGFLSNPEEANKLTDINYQKQIAFCIYCAFIEYSKMQLTT